MRFEGIERVWMKLVDADVDIAPSEDGTVHVNAEPENAFTLKRDGGLLKVMTSTGWKLKNLPRKEKERARLTMWIPDGIGIEGGMKRVSLKARRIRFDSLAIGEATAELEECEGRSLTMGPGRFKVSLLVNEKAGVAVSIGALELKVLELEGDLEVLTVMGSVALKLPEDCDAVIEPQEKDGNILMKIGRVTGSGMYRVRVSSVKGIVIVGTWGEFDDV